MSSVLTILQRLRLICDNSDFFFNRKSQCSKITPRISLIPYPSELNLPEIKVYLSKVKGKHMIWNLSEVSHQNYSLGCQIIEHVKRGYPCHGLQEIFIICNSIRSWLDSNHSNVVVLHCQGISARSHLVLSCLFVWTTSNYPSCDLALKGVCELTGQNPLTMLSPSQQRYLEYCDQIISMHKRKEKLKLRKIRLAKIELIEFPRVQNNVLIRPFISVKSGGKSIKTYSSGEQGDTIVFDLDFDLTEDVLIRCRHHYKGHISSIFKCMINSSFVDELQWTFRSNEIDWTSPESAPEHFEMRMEFTSNEVYQNHEIEGCWGAIQFMRNGSDIKDLTTEEESLFLEERIRN